MTRRPGLLNRPPSALRTVPQQQRAALTVMRIHRAALAVMREKPNLERDGVTIDEVARAANTSLPTIYRYFSSIEAVLDALVQQEQARILQQGLDLLAQRPIPSDDALVGAVVDFFVAAYSDLLAHRPLTRYLVRYHHEVG